MKNNLPFLIFSKYSFLSAAQLRIIHFSLGHPTVKKQMQVIDCADLDVFPSELRKKQLCMNRQTLSSLLTEAQKATPFSVLCQKPDQR